MFTLITLQGGLEINDINLILAVTKRIDKISLVQNVIKAEKETTNWCKPQQKIFWGVVVNDCTIEQAKVYNNCHKTNCCINNKQ